MYSANKEMGSTDESYSNTKGDNERNRAVLAKELQAGGYTRVVVRSDGEPALLAHVRAARAMTMVSDVPLESVHEQVTLQHEFVSQLQKCRQSTSCRHLWEKLRGTDRDESTSDVTWRFASTVLRLGARGCMAITAGTTAQGHSDECRARIEQKMLEDVTGEGAMRLGAGEHVQGLMMRAAEQTWR